MLVNFPQIYGEPEQRKLATILRSVFLPPNIFGFCKLQVVPGIRVRLRVYQYHPYRKPELL